MKFIAVFAAIFSLFSCASASKKEEIELEELLKNCASEVSLEIDEKVSSVAILDVQTEFWAVSDYIVDELSHYFSRRLGSSNVIAHDEFTRNLILSELEYQQTGFVSDDTIQEIGHELGVDAVIIGQLQQTSSGFNLFVKTAQTETKKILSSWKGFVSKNDKELEFQIEKSKKNSRPKIESKKSAKPNENLSIEMIGDNGEAVFVLHPNDRIRFRVFSPKDCYLSILCTDANGEEEWLPLENNFIRAGESRIFPDFSGEVLRVQDKIFGKESVRVFASATKSDLPKQTKTLGTRKFDLSSENPKLNEATIEYKVEK